MANSERPYWSNKTPEADRIEQLKRELATEKKAREQAEAAIKQQAQTFNVALDNAKKAAAHMLIRAEQLNAESRPEMIESEREANALLNERIEQLEAARRAYASEFAACNAEGEPDVGSIHENIRALKAQLVEEKARAEQAEEEAAGAWLEWLNLIAERSRTKLEASMQRERIEQLETQIAKAQGLIAQWRLQIDDTDDALFARGVTAAYKRCADELEAALPHLFERVSMEGHESG